MSELWESTKEEGALGISGTPEFSYNQFIAYFVNYQGYDASFAF